MKPVGHAAASTGKSTKSKIKDRLNPFCAEGVLPRFYAAQAAASKANAEQAAASQPASPATSERKQFLRDQGLRVRFSEEIYYRSPSPSKHGDEDEDDAVEEIGRGQKASEEDASTCPDGDNITDYIAWSNAVKNKYGHARPGTFDYFRALNAGTVSSVESPRSTDDADDPNDHGWAKMLKLPQRKRQSIAPIDYSKVQKAVTKGSFCLDGAGDDPNDHNWAGMLRLPRKQHAKSHTVDFSRPQTAPTAAAGRSSSLDGVRDPNDRGWAQKLNLRSRRHHHHQQDQGQGQDQYKNSGQYYMVPEPDQTVNDDQAKRVDPAHIERLHNTSEYHKAITDVHQNTQRRLEHTQPQPQAQVQPQQHASRPSIRSPFSFFKRDQHHSKGFDAPDVVRSPVQGPVQAPIQRPVEGQLPVQGQGSVQGQGYSRPLNIPNSFKGAVLSPEDLCRARSRYREHTLPQQQQPYAANVRPQFALPGNQPVRHPSVPIMGHVRSLGVIDKAYLGPQYQTSAPAPGAGIGGADAGQYPASAHPAASFNQYPGPASAQTQYYQTGGPQAVSPGQFPASYGYQYAGPSPVQYYAPAPGPFIQTGPLQAGMPVPMNAGTAGPVQSGAVPVNIDQASHMQSGVGPMPTGPTQAGAPSMHSGAAVNTQTGVGQMQSPTQVGASSMHAGATINVQTDVGHMQTGATPMQAGGMNTGVPANKQTGPPMQTGKYTHNPADNFGAPPRAFIKTTPFQRHPSAVFPGQIRQTDPVEHYNATGVSGAFAQTTPSQHDPSSTVSCPRTQTEPGFTHGIQTGPRQHRPAATAAATTATQKALSPTPTTSQQSSPSHVSSSSSQVVLPATRYTNVNNPNYSAHRRSVTTSAAGDGGGGPSGGHGHGPASKPKPTRPTSVGASGQPHFFRPDFTTIDPVSVQGHGHDVMIRDASFFVNRDRDVALQNLVADRTVASTGQNPFAHEDRFVRPRGVDSRDRWAGQNLDPFEEQKIANAMRQPVQKHKDGDI